MATKLTRLLQRFSEKRERRRWHRLMHRHEQIMKEGISISARATRVYPGRSTCGEMRLVYMQLCIEFLNGTRSFTQTKCLLNTDARFLEGQLIRFKFLPGNLSQIVLRY